MSSGKEGIVKSLYGIINNKNGQWDPEKPKQRDFLLSQFNDGQFVYIQSHSFGEYSGNTDKNTKTTTTIFYADQHGISKVERINSKNERSLYWENTPDAILKFQSSRDDKKFRNDFNERMEFIDRRRVYDEYLLSNSKSESSIQEELNAIMTRIAAVRDNNPSIDAGTLAEVQESLTATTNTKLAQVHASRDELIQQRNAIPDVTSATHKKIGDNVLMLTTKALTDAGPQLKRSQLDDIAKQIGGSIKAAHPELMDKAIQTLITVVMNTSTLADLHERCHRPANQEYSVADIAFQHLHFQRFADQIACALAVHDNYTPVIHETLSADAPSINDSSPPNAEPLKNDTPAVEQGVSLRLR